MCFACPLASTLFPHPTSTLLKTPPGRYRNNQHQHPEAVSRPTRGLMLLLPWSPDGSSAGPDRIIGNEGHLRALPLVGETAASPAIICTRFAKSSSHPWSGIREGAWLENLDAYYRRIREFRDKGGLWRRGPPLESSRAWVPLKWHYILICRKDNVSIFVLGALEERRLREMCLKIIISAIKYCSCTEYLFSYFYFVWKVIFLFLKKVVHKCRIVESIVMA